MFSDEYFHTFDPHLFFSPTTGVRRLVGDPASTLRGGSTRSDLGWAGEDSGGSDAKCSGGCQRNPNHQLKTVV